MIRRAVVLVAFAVTITQPASFDGAGARPTTPVRAAGGDGNCLFEVEPRRLASALGALVAKLN